MRSLCFRTALPLPFDSESSPPIGIEIMGTTISTQHDPQQYQIVKDAEQACYEYYGNVKIQEEWITVDHSSLPDSENDGDGVCDSRSLLAHVKIAHNAFVYEIFLCFVSFLCVTTLTSFRLIFSGAFN